MVIVQLEGHATETQFQISCTDWREYFVDSFSTGLRYEYFMSVDGSTSKQLFDYGTVGISQPTVFPTGNPLGGFSAQATVAVFDSVEEATYISVNLKVR